MSKPTPQCTHDKFSVCSLCSGGETPASSTAGLEPKSASTSEPRPEQDAPIEHGCNAPSPEGIADRDRASNATCAEPRRDEREVADADKKEYAEWRSENRDPTNYECYNAGYKSGASRASAALPQTSAAPLSQNVRKLWIVEWKFTGVGGDWKSIHSEPFETEAAALTYPKRQGFEYRVVEYSASQPQPSAGQTEGK